MSVVARSDDGRWRKVRETGPVAPTLVAELLRGDVAPLFDLDEPTYVVATEPEALGSPAAICAAESGALVVVVTAGDGGPALLDRQLRRAIAAFESLSYVTLMSACDELGAQHTIGTWLVQQLGSGDPVRIDERIERRLRDHEVTILVAAGCGLTAAALPVVEAQRATSATIRCFELLRLGAPGTELVEAWEPSQLELHHAARAAARQANADAMLRAAELTLGANAVPLVRAILLFSEAFFTDVAIHATMREVVLEAWFEQEGERQDVLTFDSTGRLAVRVDHLDPVDRRDLLRSIAAIVDDADLRVDVDGLAPVQLSLVDHLGDVSLVEQFVGALCDSYLGTLGTRLAATRFSARAA